ncbi:unnamed protein product [Orchesella dallaii]|uniref:Uncharacterized protein n=1 Tax=Orchesella dallaii TaxID=48710 RepID=A0ABP1PP40_9HEXA
MEEQQTRRLYYVNNNTNNWTMHDGHASHDLGNNSNKKGYKGNLEIPGLPATIKASGVPEPDLFTGIVKAIGQSPAIYDNKYNNNNIILQNHNVEGCTS